MDRDAGRRRRSVRGYLVQQRHYTVAVVVRCDTTPLQVVAGYRAQRRSWQVMTEKVGALLDEYPGPAAHDATGGGNAMGEFPALAPHDQLQGVTLVGRVRTDLFRNYIGAIERHEIVCLSSDRRVLYRAPVLRGRRSVREPGIRPIRSSPWRWPITPSRRAGSPVTTASRSDGGAGAPADLALRTGALGRHAWLPTHRRPVASAHSPCLSRPPERMWTNAVCPRLPPRRDPAHDPARNRLDRHPR